MQNSHPPNGWLFSCILPLLGKARGLFWEIQTILFFKVRSFVAYFQCPLVPRVGEKFSWSARSSRAIYKVSAHFASRDLACLDYQNNSQHIHTAPCGATSALADAFYVHYSRMLFGYSCEKHPFF